MALLDLRAEPMVLCMPEIEKARYLSACSRSSVMSRIDFRRPLTYGARRGARDEP